MAADLRTALLKSIVLQLTALVRDEGASPAIRVAAYPLSASTLQESALRMTVQCVPPRPAQRGEQGRNPVHPGAFVRPRLERRPLFGGRVQAVEEVGAGYGQ